MIGLAWQHDYQSQQNKGACKKYHETERDVWLEIVTPLLGRNANPLIERAFEDFSGMVRASSLIDNGQLAHSALYKCRRTMLPHEIQGLLSPSFVHLRSDYEMPERPASAMTTHKAASSRLPQMAGRLFGMQFLPPSRADDITWFWPVPCRLSGTKNHHFAKLRFPGFQR